MRCDPFCLHSISGQRLRAQVCLTIVRMRFLLPLLPLLVVVHGSPHLERRACAHDNCLRAFIKSSIDAEPFCASYIAAGPTATASLPAYASQCANAPARVASACACLPEAISSTSPILAPTSTTTASNVSASTSATACTATAYSEIAPAVAACTNIVLKDIFAPSNSSIDLSGLKANSIVTFAGKTTFGFTNLSSFDPITISGAGVTITAEPDAVIDGNGQAYWDGLGSNGGVPKSAKFLSLLPEPRLTFPQAKSFHRPQ